MRSSHQSSWRVAALATSAAAVTLAIVFIRKRRSTPKVVIELPAWLHKYQESLEGKSYETDEQMMEVAVQISARNVSEKTGGPFGCAIFERTKATGQCRLFAVGANRVMPLKNSTLHGETVALQFAQRKLGHFSLKSDEKEYIMCTSCEPCCMCLGATCWSGVSEMICSGTKEDAEAIGFNEGPVFPESYKQLEAMGVVVKRQVLRAEGASVLRLYGESGVIYNGS